MPKKIKVAPTKTKSKPLAMKSDILKPDMLKLGKPAKPMKAKPKSPPIKF